jgi:hypothetical protein
MRAIPCARGKYKINKKGFCNLILGYYSSLHPSTVFAKPFWFFGFLMVVSLALQVLLSTLQLKSQLSIKEIWN